MIWQDLPLFPESERKLLKWLSLCKEQRKGVDEAQKENANGDYAVVWPVVKIKKRQKKNPARFVVDSQRLTSLYVNILGSWISLTITILYTGTNQLITFNKIYGNLIWA